MPGISSDPEKAARQLAGLAKSNNLLADRLERGEPVAPRTPAPAVASASPPAAGGELETVAGLPVRRPTETHAPSPSEPGSAGHEPGTDPEPGTEPGSAGHEPGTGDPEPEPGPERRGFWAGFLEG